jgi:probable HAF family extracellular repeat protein
MPGNREGKMSTRTYIGALIATVAIAHGDARGGDPGGRPMQDLGTLDGHDFSDAWGVNESGVIVGVSERRDADGNATDMRAVRWARGDDGQATIEALAHDLENPAFPGQEIVWSRAAGVNAGGVIAAIVFVRPAPGATGAAPRAAVFRNGRFRMLGAGNVRGINDADQLVGTRAGVAGYAGMNRQGVRSEAFFWPAGASEYELLGTLGGEMSFARALNDGGTVVGLSETAGGETHAFAVWSD